jgi:hypothetical protein
MRTPPPIVAANFVSSSRPEPSGLKRAAPIVMAKYGMTWVYSASG